MSRRGSSRLGRGAPFSGLKPLPRGFRSNPSPPNAFAQLKGIVVKGADKKEHVVDSADLRRRCSCAACKDEFTGEPILQPEDVADDVYPTEIEPVGNYAVGIKWSDGHTSSIYPYERL